MNDLFEDPPDWAVVYRRVSTDMQADSLRSQEEKCDAYVLLKNLETLEVLTFEDEDVSGGTAFDQRPGGKAAMAALTGGLPVDGEWVRPRHLVVAKIDRLGRNAEDLLRMWRWASENGVTIHIIDNGGEALTTQGPIGKAIFGLIAVFAEWERAMIQDRVQQGIDAKFSRGEVIGTVPFGWDAIETDRRNKQGKPVRVLVDNEEEQRWIRRMICWRDRGKSLHFIGRKLEQNGVRPKNGGAKWSNGSIDKIIKNRHVRARLYRGGETEQEAA